MNQMTSAVPEKDAFLKGRSNQFWLCIFVAVLIVVITIAAYGPTLFNFFVTDELQQIPWLENALHTPSIIVQDFYKPWMNHLYYRPMTTVIWSFEYFLWGANGLLFRLSSITGLLLTSLMLAFVVFEMAQQTKPHHSQVAKTPLVWAISGAALFACYPLHCEPVNWFVAQHDLLVTLCFLFSFWCYLRWRSSFSKRFLAMSLVGFVIGLLTKEMAVTLPLVLAVYELVCVSRTTNLSNLSKNILYATMPYWLILAVYLCWRRIVLGTFIGNVSVNYFTGPTDMVRNWVHSIQQICFPLDIAMIAKNSPVFILWHIIVPIALVMSLYAFTLLKNRRLGLFLIGWFVISLAPTYQLLIINSHLDGSRVAYLATAPLCVYLTYGISNFSFGYKYSQLARTIGGAFFVLAAVILYCNSQAYASLGRQTNVIISELQKYYHSIKDDPPVKIFGLPPMNTVCAMGMTKMPFLDRNILNCSILDACDQSIPFGFIRKSIEKGESEIKFLYWDATSQSLKPAVPFLTSSILKRNWQNEELKSVVQLGLHSPGTVTWDGDRALHVICDRRSYLTIKLPQQHCWPINFIDLKIQMSSPPNKNLPYQFDLRFSNNIAPNLDWREICSFNTFSSTFITPNNNSQHLIYPLRAFPDWAFGEKTGELKLLLPAHCDMRIISMSLPEADTVIPIITEPAAISLSSVSNSQIIHYNASHVKDCTQVVLEVIGKDQNFEKLYCDQPDRNVIFNIPMKTNAGVLKIECKLFPGQGLYKARLRALNKEGEQVGLAGDHFLITID